MGQSAQFGCFQKKKKKKKNFEKPNLGLMNNKSKLYFALYAFDFLIVRCYLDQSSYLQSLKSNLTKKNIPYY